MGNRMKREAAPGVFTNRDMMEERTVKYLKKSSMGSSSSEMINACFQRFKERGWDLAEAELLQIANHIPVNEPEIYMIIEQCDARFSDEEVTEMLHIITECFDKNDDKM